MATERVRTKILTCLDMKTTRKNRYPRCSPTQAKGWLELGHPEAGKAGLHYRPSWMPRPGALLTLVYMDVVGNKRFRNVIWTGEPGLTLAGSVRRIEKRKRFGKVLHNQPLPVEFLVWFSPRKWRCSSGG